MKLFQLRKGAAALSLGTLLAFAATADASAQTLRLGVGTAPLSAETKALQEMAKMVEARSSGAVKVQVFEGDKLGGSVAQLENLALGTQDMHSNVADWYQYFDPGWRALAIPFVFTGVEHVKKFQATPVFAQWKQALIDKHGVRMIADNWYRLPRVLVTKTPVFKVQDLDGMRLRLPNLETYLLTWGALGVKPTVIEYSEAFLAMKTGTVAGLEAPLSGVFPQKFYQAAPYITMTNHQIAPYTVIIAEKSWKKLSPANQQILEKAAMDAGDFYYKLILDSFGDQKRKMLEEGAVFIETDTAPFVKKVDEVIKKFEAEGKLPKGLVDQIRGLAG